MTELWKPVVGFEGSYEVSDQGRVRSLDRPVAVVGRWGTDETRTYKGRLLKQNRAGTAKYNAVALADRGRVKTFLVHHLVLNSFVGPANGREGRHLNCDNYDNRLANLTWGTKRENREDSRREGTLAVGERIAQSKLTADDVIAIRATAGSHSDIADAFGVSRSQIKRIRNRDNWKHI